MNIQVVAPSACVDAEPIQLAQQHLQQFAVNAILSPHIFAQHRYLAGSIEQRISDLKQACEDPNIGAIWCGRGGTGAAQLLPYLDRWILNKPIIGYSDSTVLLNEVARLGGQALHAPVFQEIAVKNLNDVMQISSNAQEVLALLNPVLQQQKNHYPVQPLNTHAQSTKTISGKILGGNLATLCSLQGTPWALRLDQHSILLLEDVGEPYYRLERLLIQLLQSIDLKNLQAVVLGDFYHCPQKNVPQSIAEIFAEHLDPLKIPTYLGDWFGHGESNRPFWIGKTGEIDPKHLVI
ncbi:LD-carboxypeptidase [Acinetobacter puyangensis]|uniref:Murein tetrapeptidase LD-carboxypeptidase Serine peptidase. MEROPS family S66 n=1 Tax=Acinetobacter puyangensis TaxID=1096779 RepID=A0A240E465_9GAMM|nr:LD-carboxypeptidase [Acinetobacter puyangensis]SNX43321.1 murein tetrapeptidase LD-carboxypeptidase Serine peptidase. MEROPS family S66 [Acinetobacter puyangensis]